jgi:hypothetical protein
MSGAFTVPPQGRKRQAAPSPHKTYREQMAMSIRLARAALRDSQIAATS